MLDYLACILFKILGAFFRFLPVEVSFFLGRRLGDCFYFLDLRHKARSFANIKKALGEELLPCQISKITKNFYQSFGQSLIEIFLILKVDQAYMDEYISIEGLENIHAALRKGKGVILASVHAGSWELANIICANLGFPFVLFVRDQKFPRLSKLLNDYRRKKGCKIIMREGGLKHLIEAIQNNSAVGITLDQGGKSGTLVNFFGASASMSTGGLKLALKYNASVVPVFFTRVRGPKIKIFVGKELELNKSDDPEKDIKDNLGKIIPIFEEYIRKYPKDYFWTYKIWKYSNERKILVLGDGKAGHLRQAEAVAYLSRECLEKRGLRVKVEFVEVRFKSAFSQKVFSLSALLSAKFACQGCLWCLRKFLQDDAYKTLVQSKPDIIISCGSKLAAVNFIISRQNLSKSIVVMRPSLLSLKRFDLVIMPQHDHPPRNKSVVATIGALNLINNKYLQEQGDKLLQLEIPGLKLLNFCIGLLIGGDSKGFRLKNNNLGEVINQVKLACEKLDADILLTTSRRTSPEAADLIKQEFKDYARCKLMIIANEKNNPLAVGGILGLSRIVVASPESISMISEAASSAKPVIVFQAEGLGKKHEDFLKNLSRNNHIILSEAGFLAEKIEKVWQNKPAVNILRDNELVGQALEKIL